MAMRVRLVGIVVALAAGLGVGAGGCGNAPRSFGDVIMTVTVPGGVQVQSAEYTLDDKVNAPAQGVMGGSQPERQFVDLITHVPVSDHYVATVQAETVDGQMICAGSEVVKVMNGVTSRVQVVLKCGGHVLVSIGVSCHDTPLVSFLVSPLSASVGAYVIGQAVSARPDGGPLTLTWSAPSGTFADPSAPQTTFTCTQAGPVTLTLRVEDDELCQQSYSSLVTCFSVPDAGADAALDAHVDAGPG